MDAIVRPGGINQEKPCEKRRDESRSNRRFELAPFFHNLYAHALLSVNLEEPTASSVVDQGELIAASAPGLGNDEDARWLLREKLPQLPALPALACPFARG